MSLVDFITQYFIEYSIPRETKTGKSLILAVTKGYREAGITASTLSKFTKTYFPNKPKGQKVSTFLLIKTEQQYCLSCKEVLPQNCFYKNNARTTKHSNKCKKCEQPSRAGYMKHYQAMRRAALLQRTPAWASLEEIADFYSNCPEGYHVDHIIPLQGEKVSGLHVINNLQYLPAKENLIKSNKFIIK